MIMKGSKGGKQPWVEKQNQLYGYKPPYRIFRCKSKYSYIKTPRWKGQAMEVGPLARMLVGYASGREEFKK